MTPLPRLRIANRHLVEPRCESLDQLLPPEHQARAVLAFVETLDLSPLLADIAAVSGHAGAPAFDPHLLLAVWLYATIEGIGSSRELEELCQRHLVYRWLCGGLSISYHTLSDFRSGHGDFLNQLLTQLTATLLHAEVITLQQVAQDGMRVRAAAGASSFRRGATLDECLAAATQQVELLQRQQDEDAGAVNRRSQAARLRAARERVARLHAAQEELQKLQAANAARPPCRRVADATLRVSLTDPEARKMKMPDGGFRPAYNAQFATTTTSGVIVGVALTNEGTDANEMSPMVQQIAERLGQPPEAMLVDGGYASHDAIDAVQASGTRVFAPVRDERKLLAAGMDPYAAKAKDTEQTAEWRARMGTAAAKATYKLRACTAEWVNAQVRNRDLYRVTVRGQEKVLTVLLWHVLAHNFGRLAVLSSAGPGGGARPTP